jgi:hypothetical protein
MGGGGHAEVFSPYLRLSEGMAASGRFSQRLKRLAEKQLAKERSAKERFAIKRLAVKHGCWGGLIDCAQWYRVGVFPKKGEDGTSGLSRESKPIDNPLAKVSATCCGVNLAVRCWGGFDLFDLFDL